MYRKRILYKNRYGEAQVLERAYIGIYLDFEVASFIEKFIKDVYLKRGRKSQFIVNAILYYIQKIQEGEVKINNEGAVQELREGDTRTPPTEQAILQSYMLAPTLQAKEEKSEQTVGSLENKKVE